MPTTLNTRFVGVTAGLVKPKTLIWKGKMRKAPDIPAIEVKNDMTSPTSGGTHRAVSTPETGNVITTSDPTLGNATLKHGTGHSCRVSVIGWSTIHSRMRHV